MPLNDAKQLMDDALDSVRREFSTVRTGKATPALLDTIRVDAYGSKVAINQLATVGTPEATMLVVQPFDKTLLPDIERAIMAAELGLNPANDGNLIRIPIPPLNEERRKEYARLLHKMAEEGRVSVRHARKTANDEIKQLMHDHEVSEDEGHRDMQAIQKMTDDLIKQIDELLDHKEEEVMAI